jgi:hypothetical protein
MKKPERAHFHFLQKPPSCPFERFTLESDKNNIHLHQMIETESDTKSDSHLLKDIKRYECSD